MGPPNLLPIPWNERDMLPDPEEVRILGRIAALPRNYKKGTRAQFILWYAAGKPREEILAALHVSEDSLRRWYTRWVDEGLDGLLHLGESSLERVIEHVAREDPALASRIRTAIARVRSLVPDEDWNEENEHPVQEVTMTKTNETLIDQNQPELWEIPVKAISPNPDQPRTEFDEAALNELADSIREHGLIQPVVVTPNGSADHFVLLVGERRWRAAQLAGLEVIPAIVKRQVDDRVRAEIALIENVQRENLSAADEARAYQALSTKYGYSDEQIAQRVGKARTTVANLKRLLALPTEVLEMIGEGQNQIPQGVARRLVPLARIKPEAVSTAAKEIAADPDQVDRIVEQAINHNAIQIHFGWDARWPESPTTVTAGQTTGGVEVRACEGCPCSMRIGQTWYCSDKTCHEAKGGWFVQEELQRVSHALKIPLAGPDEKVTPFKIEYSTAPRITTWLKAKPRPDHLRLVPLPVGWHTGWQDKELLKSTVVTLASTAGDIEKLLTSRAKDPQPAPPADESPEQKAKRQAAEEKQRDENRVERALARKAKADVSWLGVHTAEILAGQLTASGATLDYLSEFVCNRVRPNGHWVEIEDVIKDVEKAVETVSDKNAEDLRRRLILLSLLNEKCSHYEPKQIYIWDHVEAKVEELAEELGLKLPTGWNKPPLHHTEANCWMCGEFTSLDRITKRDEEEGWQTAVDSTVTCSDECRAQVKPGQSSKATAKKSAKPTAKKVTKKEVKK